MNTLKGVFSNPKPPKRNFIQENVRQLREMTNYWQSKDGDDQLLQFPQKLNKYMNVPARVPLHVTGGKTIIAKKSPELQNLRSKSRNLKSQPKALAASKSSPGNKFPKVVKQPRKTRTVGRAKTGVDESRLREGDVAEYVRKQRETVLSRPKRNENGYSDTDLSPEDSDSDSVEYIKPPASSFNRRNTGVAHKSTACQTVEPDRLESLYDEGIIRYPSAVRSSAAKMSTASKNISFRNMSQQTERSQTPAYKSSLPIERQDRPSATMTSVRSEKMNAIDPELNLELNDSQQRGADFIRMNAKAASAVPSRIPALNRSDRLKPPPTYQRGIVPKYLQKRQTQLHKDEEHKQQNAPDPTCPPGHVPLPETERKESLKMLRKSYADLVHELNTLPVRADTLRIRQRKMDIEKQLNKLEEGIKVFSRPKVFVKIGD